MREVTLMNPSKVTENKLRWSMDVGGVSFKLYIPKDRVPKPWPRHIIVSVFEHLAEHQKPGILEEKSLEKPIVCLVKKVSEHTETVRYCPIGEPETWELGEPYIPYNLLPANVPDQLVVEVKWDHNSGTWGD